MFQLSEWTNSAKLADGFVDGSVDGAGEIQAADFGAHWQLEIAVGLLAQDCGGEAARFTAKK